MKGEYKYSTQITTIRGVIRLTKDQSKRIRLGKLIDRIKEIEKEFEEIMSE